MEFMVTHRPLVMGQREYAISTGLAAPGTGNAPHEQATFVVIATMVAFQLPSSLLGGLLFVITGGRGISQASGNLSSVCPSASTNYGLGSPIIAIAGPDGTFERLLVPNVNNVYANTGNVVGVARS